IGNTLLNEIVNEKKIYDPADILSTLHEGIKKGLKQTETGNTDGMDVCLCKIEFNERQLQYILTFAGAKRPLYIVSKQQMTVLKGNRRSIGGTEQINTNPFENQRLTLTTGDCLYLSSDGLTDCPNPQRQKLGVKRFVKFIQTHHHLSMLQQKRLLQEEVAAHRRDAIKRDDILVLGVRL
ncbi:MAG: SpoIIE family protein phosphatase, partial [Bacteroidota bacterium]